MKKSQKKKSMKQKQFIDAAVNTVISSMDDKSVKSLQNVINKLQKEYKDNKNIKLPCRDTMYKYLSNCISEFEVENDVAGLNHFGVFRKYSIATNALKGLLKLCKFNYKTIVEDANGFYIGLLCVKPQREGVISDYISKNFSDFVMSLFPGTGGIIIFFKNANREAEFYNLLTPFNSDYFD